MTGLARRAALVALTITILAGLGVTSASAAEPFRLDRVVPADSFLIATAPDVAAAERAFSRTGLSRIWHDEEVQVFIAPLVEMLGEQVERLREKDGVDLADLLTCFRGEVGIALLDIDLARGAPYPNLLVSIDARENREKLEKFIALAIAKASEGDKSLKTRVREFRGVSVRVFEDGQSRVDGAFLGDTFLFGSVPASLDAAILAHAGESDGSLAGLPLYRDAMARVEGAGTPVFRVFVNVERILGAFASFLAPYESYLTETGVSGLKAIAATSSIDGIGFTDRLHLHAPGATKGLFKVASSRPVDRAMLAGVPENAFHVTVGTMDLAVVWDEVMRILATVQPDAFASVADGIGEIEKGLGFRLKKDLVDSIGGDFMLYAAPPRGGGGFIPEVLLSLAVQDEAAFTACLDKALAAAASEFGEDEFVRDRLEYQGRVIHFLRLPAGIPVTPAFTFLDGRLLVALMPQTLKGVIRENGSESPEKSILDREDIKTALARVPASASSIGLTDLASIFDLAYNTALPFLQSQDGVFGELPLDPALLPSAEAISRHLGIAVSGAWSDASGMSWTLHSPISVVTLLGPSILGTFALVSGGAEPMEIGPTAEARPASLPSDVANQLEIGTRLLIYYVENDSYPETLEELVTTGLLDAKYLVSPDDESPRTLGSVVCSYDYVGPGIGKLAPKDRSSAVLVWSRTAPRTVLYLDSPLPRRVDEKTFEAHLEETRRRIRAAGGK